MRRAGSVLKRGSLTVKAMCVLCFATELPAWVGVCGWMVANQRDGEQAEREEGTHSGQLEVAWDT